MLAIKLFELGGNDVSQRNRSIRIAKASTSCSSDGITVPPGVGEEPEEEIPEEPEEEEEVIINETGEEESVSLNISFGDEEELPVTGEITEEPTVTEAPEMPQIYKTALVAIITLIIIIVLIVRFAFLFKS